MWLIAWTCWAISLLGLGSAEKAARIITVKTGSDVVLNCDTEEDKKPFELINWNLNNSKSHIFAKFMDLKPFIGNRFSRRLHIFNNSAILISHITPTDAGIYRCKTMTSSSGSNPGVILHGTPIKLVVQVILPFFLKLPPKKIQSEPNSVWPITLDCIVGGVPKPNIQWSRLDGVLPLDRTTIRPNGSLTFSRIDISDTGRYECSASNEYGSVSHVSHINVTRTTQPLPSHRKTTKEGFPALLDCLLDSSVATSNLQYSWTKDGKNVMSPPQSGISILLVGSLFIKTSKRTDSGVYQCTARALDSTGTKILTYAGSDVFLDVHYAPSIILIEAVASASQGSDVRLPCVSQANPGTVSTAWSRGSQSLKGPRYAVLQEGSLLIRSVKTSDAGIYTCTPSNALGKGNSKSTRLEVKIVPRFTVVPPAVRTVRLGDDINLECSAVSDVSPTVKVTWIRVGESLPPGRTTLNGGKLTIANVQRSDDGQYMCLATANEGVAKHSTSITVLATPGAPNITRRVISGKSVTITWLPGHDGGFPQKFEVWYRKATDTDYQWKRINLLPPGSNSYTLKNTGSLYLFAVRGINSEGAGTFSGVIQGNTGSSPNYLPDKPLPPTNVIVNITSDGYYVSWKHQEVPGRPVVNTFVVEYRENNTSNAWIRVDESVDGDKRVHLLKANLFEPDVVYEFRVYAFGNKLSEPAYASKTYVIASPVVAARKDKTNYIPIVAGVLGAIAFLVLIGFLCFCLVQYSSRKKSGDKSAKKVHFLLPDSKSKAQVATEPLDDFNDEEIKLHPETVRFVPDTNIGMGNHWRRKINKEEDFFLLSSCDHIFGGDKLDYVNGPRSIPLASPPVTSPKDGVTFFGDVEQNGWYDCTLGRPANNEVRDSYDQFCRSPSDIGSRDSLDRDALKRALYEHQGSKIQLVKKFDGSNASLQFDKGKPVRGPRFKTPPPGVSEDAALARSRNHPHHWSLPAVYSHSADWRNLPNNRDSDSDSVGSFGRRRRRVHRPSSYYEGSVSQQPELVPITEQDSDPNLRCSCEEDEPESTTKSIDLGRGSESSYLHLERNDSLKQPYMDRLKAWDEESDGSVGKPYGPHPKLTDDEALQSIDSTSEQSVSPAHSLASLTDSEVDGEINRHIVNDTLDSKMLSEGSEKLRGNPYMNHLDLEPASDISEKGDLKGGKVINESATLPRYEVPRVTNLKPGLHADSLDKLKVCDPFYQRMRNSVCRSPSNASSGIQVSSSETNSVDSPIVSRRQSGKGSARSSATSSGFESSSSARESLGSEGPFSIPNKTNSLRSSPKHRFPYLDEPYEWDREGTGSEFESGSEVGHSYKPNMIANMRHLLDLQQRLGIDLDSSSSSESLSDKNKLDKLTIPEMVNYSPDVPPSTFEVDNYSTGEKDKRCSKLMDEYKANTKVQNEKLNGSMIYQCWDL